MKFVFKYFLIFSFLSCTDNGPNCPGDMNLPIVISPYNHFYNVGDTISISSKLHKFIYDKKTDLFLDASNYHFTPIITMNTLDSSVDYNSKSKIHELSFYLKENTEYMHLSFSSDEGAIVGEYQVGKDSLEFKVKLIILKKGFFLFRVASLSTGDSHLQNNYKFNCRDREIEFYLESPKENTIQLLQQYRTNERNDWILSDSINRFYNHAGYCFEVR